MSKRDRILLTAVKEFDSIFNDRSSNFLIAIRKCDERDTSHFYINEIYVIADIKHKDLKYVYRYRRLGIPFSVPLTHGIERNFQRSELNQI